MAEGARATGLTRRRLLRDGGAAGASLLLGVPRLSLARGPRRRRETVAVLGGGVAGLSVAHELAERGFGVTVYERRALGGKARSHGVPGTARGGRDPLPGEHGMRFFPGFYTNLPDTLRRIPCGSNPNGVFDNLVAASQLAFARDGGREEAVLPLTGGSPSGGDPGTGGSALVGALSQLGDLPPGDAEYFAERLHVFMTSSEQRRAGDWENETWWSFVRAESRSEEYRRVLVNSITRQILAAKASRASARSVGLLWEAFLMNFAGRSGTGGFDRILDAPTNEAWINPWVRHLRARNVKFRMNHSVTGLEVRNGRIVAARARTPRGAQLIRSDWFVCAMPVERARRLWSPEVLRSDPDLRRTRRLKTDSMNGIQFYLREPVPVVHGHALHIDSPWALASLSQAQFWDERRFTRDYGDGRVTDCISVDIGDMRTPGLLHRRPARDLEPRQIAREVWHQLKLHLNNAGQPRLRDSNLVRWHLDPSLVRRKGGGVRSIEPLLINTPGSWKNRPGATTRLRNLLLAADYVRVDVNIACMEGANEAARRAVNALLDRSGSRAEPCQVHELYEPPEYKAAKEADAVLYAAGRPHALDR